MSELPPQQSKAVAAQVLKTWWLWAAFGAVIASGLVAVEQITSYRTRRFEAELHQAASNQLAVSLTVVSNALREQLASSFSNQFTSGFFGISNQVASALEPGKIQSAIDAATALQATQLMMRAIAPVLSNFQAQLAQAQARPAVVAPAVQQAPPDPPKVAPAKQPEQPAPAAAAAAPADGGSSLVFDSESVTRQGAAYVLTVSFRRTGSKPLNTLDFAVGAYNQLPARILGVDADVSSARTLNTTIDPSGLEARLSVAPMGQANPAIRVVLSGPTVIQIASDALPEPATVPVMQNLPGSTPAK
jgi:hypothetical protein